MTANGHNRVAKSGHNRKAGTHYHLNFFSDYYYCELLCRPTPLPTVAACFSFAQRASRRRGWDAWATVFIPYVAFFVGDTVFFVKFILG